MLDVLMRVAHRKEKKIQEEEQKKKDVGSCRKITDMLTKTVSDVTSTVESADTSDHTGSTTHRSCILASVFRAQKKGLLDSHLENQTEKERTYWRKVLERVVAVVKFLALRGLAFRGENEAFGSENNVNFLGIIELLAQFDPFLANHVSRLGNAGRGTVSYMSSTICNEFIELMTKKVLNNIIAAVKTAKYFAISVDSTLDISHTDQLTFIVRFVDSSGKPVERFIKFIPLSGHDGETMMNVVLDTLLEHDLSIMDCRGQSYDNASNMSGKYNGLQARIKQINPLAEYVPCSAHSLNLVGSCAAECCVAAVSFFGLLQALFNFFSASTHRWSILKSTIHGDVIKSLSTTRWSTQHDAAHALKDSFAEIRSALIQIAEDEDQGVVSEPQYSSLESTSDLKRIIMGLASLVLKVLIIHPIITSGMKSAGSFTTGQGSVKGITAGPWSARG
ncbi:zinc finger MYM-type protein 1-like [Cherax quadricarinatus]|uniref:zinc finger MYM-type protein 1-like n=1 Tax=Cherax quadricarinatus TaxID=27406 RepID=UPI00387EB5C8